MIAGGSDSTSNAEVKLPQKVVHTLAPLALRQGARRRDYLGALAQLMPLSEILPAAPEDRRAHHRRGDGRVGRARWRARNEISREAQDEFAARSHHRAAAAIAQRPLRRRGHAGADAGEGWVHADNLVRADTSVEKLAKLRPVFAKDGTLTAGNASPLTDGAAAVAADERGEGARARLQAARRVPLAGLRRRRSGRSAADGPGARDARRRSTAPA